MAANDRRGAAGWFTPLGLGQPADKGLLYRLDFGARSWYTRRVRASHNPLNLLTLLKLRGNPSLRSELNQTLVLAGA